MRPFAPHAAALAPYCRATWALRPHALYVTMYSDGNVIQEWWQFRNWASDLLHALGLNVVGGHLHMAYPVSCTFTCDCPDPERPHATQYLTVEQFMLRKPSTGMYCPEEWAEALTWLQRKFEGSYIQHSDEEWDDLLTGYLYDKLGY